LGGKEKMESINLYLISGLDFTNQVLNAAIVILAFSFLAYILVYNLTNSVARSFCALIACVCVAYAGDMALSKVDSFAAAVPWLKLQWLGIAFTPAAYLHFSDTLLRTTNAVSRLRRAAVWGSYAVGLALLPLAFFTELLVHDGVYAPSATQFTAGPLFWLFAAYFFVSVLWGAWNIYQARRRCLTSTSRRRMTYLAISFAAPALGVFPYLLVASMPAFLPLAGFLLILLLGNIGVAMMLVVMAYSVAYFGVLTPDRVVRHNLIHYLLRGPLVATAVIFIVLAVPKMSRILGLPRDMILIGSVVSVIVLMQLFVNLAKPAIDRLTYRWDSKEMTWIQQLDNRLLTTTDLRQALENVLTALCDVLRVRTGFVAEVTEGKEMRIEAYCGSLAASEACLEGLDQPSIIRLAGDGNGQGEQREKGTFVSRNGFWLMPLLTKKRDRVLGLLAVEAKSTRPELHDDEAKVVSLLASRAELALEDRQLQQGVFKALEQIIPEIEQVQRWRGTVRYSGSPQPTAEILAENLVSSPDFAQFVRDALNHYWGGPKLTQSPLLKLRIVQEALQEHDGNPAKALRAVLTRAIESLRPDGARRMTTAEWILYNILELKFIQGLRVRDIALRLAMSESDLYRKQRVAIEQVAQTLAVMEQDDNCDQLLDNNREVPYNEL
jgi:hypothetical protein